ncbi:putative MFS-type transporter C18.02 [Cladobotryum mycophilum]|uniref:MFS-type transporter C18.02 n=1 Tax=Cladobotryum mycophilum TaxID=491253 RepID=A0ABR0SYT1_9HYPO
MLRLLPCRLPETCEWMAMIPAILISFHEPLRIDVFEFPVLYLYLSRVFVILTVAVAVFADLFTYSIIIPILPTILDRRVHVPPEKIQVTLAGMLAAYNAANIICSPISGYLADKWSNRKIPLLAGLLALTGSTVLFAVSKNVGLLYLARILQGASGSIVWSVGFALLVDSVPTEEVGSAMGWASVGLSLGNTSGPLVGGIVYQRAGHYATFSLAFAVVAVDIVFRCILREPAPQNTTVSKETPSQEDLPCQTTESHDDSETKSDNASEPGSPVSEKHADDKPQQQQQQQEKKEKSLARQSFSF